MPRLMAAITKKLNEWTGSELPRLIANNTLKERATVTELDIDPDAHTIRAKFQVKGQPAPWTIVIEGCSLSEDGDSGQLAWTRIQLEAGAAKLPLDLKRKLDFIL